MMLAPSANRVYANESVSLSVAELAVCAPFASIVRPTDVAGVPSIVFEADELDDERRAVLAGQSNFLALLQVAGTGDLLRPLDLADPHVLDDDLVTIPKYAGKTNEQFTRLLANVTLAAVERPLDHGGRVVLDPLAGRGTTLSTLWRMGHHAAGVEGDEKALEAYAAFLKSYLRRKRLKHTADTTPVRREGKAVGKRFDAELVLPDGRLDLTLFSGDTRQSAALFGKKKFDAIVTDAPYGVVHGSVGAAATGGVRGVSGKRDRSPAGLLREAIPVWAGQLKSGGAMGIAWNTHGLARKDLAAMLTDAGLLVHDDGPWCGFSHRVDSSIQRDVVVAVKRP